MPQPRIKRTPEGEPLAAFSLWEAYVAAVTGAKKRRPKRPLHQWVRTAASWESHAAKSEEPVARVPFAFCGQSVLTGLYIRGQWGRWYRRLRYLQLVATEAESLIGAVRAREFWAACYEEADRQPPKTWPWRRRRGNLLVAQVLQAQPRPLPETRGLPPMRTGLKLRATPNVT